MKVCFVCVCVCVCVCLWQVMAEDKVLGKGKKARGQMGFMQKYHHKVRCPQTIAPHHRP